MPIFRKLHKEVIDFANGHMLSTNLGPIINKLDRTSEFRGSHLVPPAFQDRRKEENKYGDLVIWEEIIKHLRASREDPPIAGRDVVLISRDQKTDWVSAAPFVVNLKGELIATPL